MKLTLEELREKVSEVGPVWLYYPDEYALLYWYAGLSNGPIVEIGTAYGGSAVILTLGSDKSVLSIDPYEQQVDGYKPDPTKVFTTVRDVLSFHRERWSLWLRSSECAAKSYNFFNKDVGRIGLLFIDGDHSYESVKQDVELWLPKIRRRGYLILHDSNMSDSPHEGYCMGYAGPTQVSNELKSDKRVRWLETAYSMTVWEVL